MCMLEGRQRSSKNPIFSSAVGLPIIFKLLMSTRLTIDGYPASTLSSLNSKK